MTDRKGITEFEDRVEEAAMLAQIDYSRSMYFCITCRYIGKMDNPTRWQGICHNCNSVFSETVKHVEPDGVIYADIARLDVGHKFKEYGLLFIDGGVHDKFTRLIKDDYSRRVMTEMKIPLFVLHNAEVGKPRHITKQKHEEYIPSSPMVISVTRQMNLAAVLLGFRYLVEHPDLYAKMAGAEKEITGLGMHPKPLRWK